jgi:multisubunit Na+/H+ antiporter MnhB subunit
MEPDSPDSPARLLRALLGAACLGLVAVLGWGFVSLPLSDAGLRDTVNAQISVSGVSNPVTAVLLNFRAYDTLLELAVLLLAVLGVWSLSRAVPRIMPASTILAALVRILLPLLVISAAYLLWLGAHAPGGAFQAGALLGAGGVLLRLAGRETAGLPSPLVLRLVLVAGTSVFLAVGVGVMGTGRAFLEYPLPLAGTLILAIEASATVAIGATLAALYVGAPPEHICFRRGGGVPGA